MYKDEGDVFDLFVCMEGREQRNEGGKDDNKKIRFNEISQEEYVNAKKQAIGKRKQIHSRTKASKLAKASKFIRIDVISFQCKTKHKVKPHKRNCKHIHTNNQVY